MACNPMMGSADEHAGSPVQSDRFEFVAEVVLEVPLLGGVESEFEADEEAVLVRLEVVDGLGRDDRVEAEEAFLVCVADKDHLVPGELRRGVRVSGASATPVSFWKWNRPELYF